LEACVDFLLKTDRLEPATELAEHDAQGILKRSRHEGRKLVEVFVLSQDGTVDRFQERTRRKLGSNAIASRTWLCETASDGEWVNGRYIPEPLEAIGVMDPAPVAVVLVLQGADGAPETTIQQLSAMVAAG
jgi:hypothetical protein